MLSNRTVVGALAAVGAAVAVTLVIIAAQPSAGDEPASPGTQSTGSPVTSEQRAGDARDYWTPERMRDAEPR